MDMRRTGRKENSVDGDVTQGGGSIEVSQQTSIDDGGPAFLFTDAHGFIGCGMTVRDWFAGQALLAMRYTGATAYKDDAEACYKMADAMMQARKP